MKGKKNGISFVRGGGVGGGVVCYESGTCEFEK